MIIVDLNQTVIANVMMGLSKNIPGDLEIDEGLLTHMIIRSLLTISRKFKGQYGKMVIASDGKNVWRKESFPYYKANRKKRIDNSIIDWKMLFNVLDNVRNDLINRLPWPTVYVDKAEADDIISVLSREFSKHEKVMIVSGDNDFVQLHGPNVFQWNHVAKKEITGDPVTHLMTKIIRGDVGDGVPNFLSDGDTLVVQGKRQKPVMEKKLISWAGMSKEEICDGDEKLLKNWERNVLMMDLSCVPKEIKLEIEHKYKEQLNKNVMLSQVTEYLMEKNLRKLMEDVQDFR